MGKFVKYSKPYNDIVAIKIEDGFTVENNKHLLNNAKERRKFLLGEKREGCIICNHVLTKDFEHQLLDYAVCKNCSHLNSIIEPSKEFNEEVYHVHDGINHHIYNVDDKKKYNNRVEKIYKPKVDFLLESLKKSKDKEKQSVIDIGCGSGHFVKALEDKNITAEGYEVNRSNIKLGNNILKKNKLFYNNINNMKKLIIEKGKSNSVLSMIGVLEHIENPHHALDGFKNSNFKYFYISVPLVSLNTLLDVTFQKIYPRHLNVNHTHLFTESSINYLMKKYNLEIISEWWFGLDFKDLLDKILLNLKIKDKGFYDLLNKYYSDSIDELQHVLDKKKQCSEVHFLCKNK